MIKEITYQGMSTAISDFVSEDGQIAFSQNAINEGKGVEAMITTNPGKPMSGFAPFYVHDGRSIAVWKHGNTRSVVYDVNANIENISYQSLPGHIDLNGVEDVSATHIGNTLIVFADGAINYFLWSGTDYLHLGNHLPELELTFGLQGQEVVATRTTQSGTKETAWKYWNDRSDVKVYPKYITGSDSKNDGLIIDYPQADGDNNKKIVNDNVLAAVNKFIAEEGTDKGKFVFPFFVRYAYRLFDGSLTMHSAPVLMLPSTHIAPYVFLDGVAIDNNTQYEVYQFLVGGTVCQLDVAINDLINYDSDKLKAWKDIIRSVDIFISKPIYSYDQAGEITHIELFDQNKSHSICKFPDNMNITLSYERRPYINTFRDINNESNNKEPIVVRLPHRETDFYDDIRKVSTFYFLKSYELENLPTTRTLVDIPEKYLSTIATREVMSDDYDSHDILNAKYAFPYNSRLNLTNLNKSLFIGQSIHSRICYQNPVPSYQKSLEQITELRIDGEDHLLKTSYDSLALLDGTVRVYYLYHQDPRATNVYWSLSGNARKFALRASDFLNGAYYFDEFNDSFGLISTPTNTKDSVTIPLRNKLYTSEVNNPFLFLPSNIKTIGDGDVIALGVSTHAISDGQFGQYPMYAFTNDGIWALSVSETGSFSSVQPISREVIVHPKSLVALGSELLFTTDRGVFSLQGAQAQIISTAFVPFEHFDSGTLPNYGAYKDAVNFNRVKEVDTDFCTYIKGAMPAYDYVTQRVYYSNPNYEYSYVFSIQSNLWSTTELKFDKVLNTFPDTWVTIPTDIEDTTILTKLSSRKAPFDAVLITRPLKLGSPSAFKTIEKVIQRGNFQPSNVKQVLYGSNDLKTWRPLASSVDKYLNGLCGHAYKYFRLVLFLALQEGESLTGCTIEFQERGNNILR